MRRMLFAVGIVLFSTWQPAFARTYSYVRTVGTGYDFATINSAIADIKQNTLTTASLGCIQVYPGTYIEQLNDFYPNSHTLPAHCDLIGMGTSPASVVIQHQRRAESDPNFTDEVSEIYAAGVLCGGDNIVQNIEVANVGENQNSIQFQSNGTLTNCIINSGHDAVTCYGQISISGCSISGMYRSCIYAYSTFSISNCTLHPSTRDYSGEHPAGIEAYQSGTISNVTISANVSSSDYVPHYDTPWLAGVIAVLYNRNDTISINNLRVNLTLTTIDHNDMPDEIADWEVFGIVSGWRNPSPTTYYPGTVNVTDCNISVTGIEQARGIMVGGIVVRGGGTVNVLGNSSITTARTTGQYAANGYQYALVNQNGILTVDSNVVYDHNSTSGTISAYVVPITNDSNQSQSPVPDSNIAQDSNNNTQMDGNSVIIYNNGNSFSSGNQTTNMSLVWQDANSANVVNLCDFAKLAAYWQQSGPNLAGDLDGNGTVDWADLAILLHYWLMPAPVWPSGPASFAPGTNAVTLKGEFIYSAGDIVVKGRAMDVVIGRTYRSGIYYASVFGYNWDMSYNMKLRTLGQANSIVFFDGQDKRREYTLLQGSSPATYLPPPGYFDNIVKDANGAYTMTENDGGKYLFDPNGNMTAIRDKNNNAVTFGYDSSQRLSTITDDLGRNITFSYNSSGLLNTITDSQGRVWTYGYDSSRNLTGVTSPGTDENPSGLTTTYGYSGHNLTTITDPNGQAWVNNTYDTSGRVTNHTYGTGAVTLDYHPDANYTRTTSANGYDTNSVYNSAGLVTKETVYTKGLRSGDPAFYVTQYQYDANNQLIKKILPGGNYINYSYDGSGNLTSIAAEPNDSDPDIVTRYTYTMNRTTTDPLGRVTTFDYDLNGNLTAIIYPEVETPDGNNNPIVQFTYNSFGQIATITNPNNLVTQFEYYAGGSGIGKLWKARIDPDGLNITTTYEYDGGGNINKVTDANGAIWTITYDKLNEANSVTSPHNITTQLKYNPNKMLNEITKPLGANNQTVGYAYNILDKIKTVTNPLGYNTGLHYDKQNDINDVNDAESNHTSAVYDERGLLWKITDANGGVTEYSYTRNGKLADINDPNGNVTSYSYDGFDRLTRVTFPDGTYEEFTYDKNSNIVSKRTRKGDTIYYAYDTLNRLKTKTLPGNIVTNYYYDIAGRLVEVNDNGSYTYNSYDRFGRLISTTNPVNYTVQYSYDVLGRRTNLVYPDGSYIAYRYDAMSRLIEIDYTPYGGTATTAALYSYDALDRRTALSYGNGTSASYTYDIGNQLYTLTNSFSGSSSVIQYTSYDKVGNRLNMIVDSNESYYTYDKLYQLLFVDYPSAWGIADVNYYYDVLGNRTSTKANGSTTSYLHNRLNQYSSVSSAAYSYDLNGNLSNDGTYKYYYDAENKLTSVTNQSNSAIATYAYDYQGRRISKTDYTLSPAVVTLFVYDGDNIIAEYDGSGNLLRKYINGPRIDEPVCMISPSETKYYYHFDGLGSVAALTDSSGNIAEKYRYDAFGKTTIFAPDNSVLSVSSVANRFMFTGREYEAETGNYYYRARFYKPSIGRFLQPDPVGYMGGLNLYTYCGNNPINSTDFSGLLGFGIGGSGMGGNGVGGLVGVEAHFDFSGNTGIYIYAGAGAYAGVANSDVTFDVSGFTGTVYDRAGPSVITGFVGGQGYVGGGSVSYSPQSGSEGLTISPFGGGGGLTPGAGYGVAGNSVNVPLNQVISTQIIVNYWTSVGQIVSNWITNSIGKTPPSSPPGTPSSPSATTYTLTFNTNGEPIVPHGCGNVCSECNGTLWPDGNTPKYVIAEISGIQVTQCPDNPYCSMWNYDVFTPPNGFYLLEQQNNQCEWTYFDQDWECGYGLEIVWWPSGFYVGVLGIFVSQETDDCALEFDNILTGPADFDNFCNVIENDKSWFYGGHVKITLGVCP